MVPFCVRVCVCVCVRTIGKVLRCSLKQKSIYFLSKICRHYFPVIWLTLWFSGSLKWSRFLTLCIWSIFTFQKLVASSPCLQRSDISLCHTRVDLFSWITPGTCDPFQSGTPPLQQQWGVFYLLFSHSGTPAVWMLGPYTSPRFSHLPCPASHLCTYLCLIRKLTFIDRFEYNSRF